MLATKTIKCHRSGVPLATVTAVCSHGWPLLNSVQATLLHPIYNLPLPRLLLNLREQLESAESVAWCVPDDAILDIRLTVSAIMYDLGCFWQAPPDSNLHVPSLPSAPVTIGSGSRLLSLASWYSFATSKRLAFPTYRVSKTNSNLEWENFSAWLDDAFTIKEEWQSGKDKYAHEDELRRREHALLEVRRESVYKKLDIQKIWAWIDTQMKQHHDYPAGRRETFKSIFMRGELSPEEWTVDDIEDVHFAVVETCDMGNEISFFINNRLRQIRAVIEDFYSSFTLLSKVSSEGLDALDAVTPAEQAASTAFFSSFDKRASELETLPDAPKRDSFASYPKFLQAQAQWNILKRRYESLAASKQTTNTAADTGSQA